MSFGKGQVTRGLPMQESQLNDKGSMTKAIVKNCNGKVLWFSCKQMRTNNVFDRIQRRVSQMASGMFTLH
jgi:hypothetical protein